MARGFCSRTEWTGWDLNPEHQPGVCQRDRAGAFTRAQAPGCAAVHDAPKASDQFLRCL